MSIVFIGLAKERPLVQADVKHLLTMIPYLDGMDVGGIITSGDNDPLRGWNVTTFHIDAPGADFQQAAVLFTSAGKEPGDPLNQPDVYSTTMRDDVVKICQLFRVDFDSTVIDMRTLHTGCVVVFEGLAPKITELLDNHQRLEQKGRLM